MKECTLKDYDKTSDVLVKARGGLRGKPHRILKDAKVYAVVGFGSMPGHSDYQQPYLILAMEKSWGDTEKYSTNLLTISFQRSRADRRLSYESADDYAFRGKRPAMRGFMARYRGMWSYSYAGRVEHNLDRRTELSVGLGLLDRAHDFLHDWDGSGRKILNAIQAKAAGCELLKLIAGLSHIGIPVIVKNGRQCKLPTEYALVA